MDKRSTFQITHSAGDLGSDVHENDGVNVIFIRVPQIIQQIAFIHKFGNNIKWRFSGTDPCINQNRTLKKGFKSRRR